MAGLTLLSRLESRIQDEGVLRRGEKILVACSGGPDSAALARLLSELAPKWRWRPALAYFHHGLRHAADTDLRFVRKLARELRVPFYFDRGKVRLSAKAEKESLEEAARRLRYAFLEKTARAHGFKKVVLAHTLDDQAETVLMRILQGTGLRGLGGIRTVIRKKGICFYRPLLSFSKKELLEELRRMKAAFRTDASNRSLRFLRNRIRHRLMPELEKHFNPRIRDALVRLQTNLEEDLEALSYAEAGAWKQAVISKKSKVICLRRDALEALPASLRFRILSRAVQELNSRCGINFDAWRRIAAALHQPSAQMHLSGALCLQIRPSEIRLTA